MSRLTTGGPKSGKSTKAPKALATDALGFARNDFATRVDTVAGWIRGQKDVEGVLVPHALRRVLRDPQARLDGIQVDVLDRTYGALSPGQQAMQKAVGTIMREIEPELVKRGARVRHHP